MHIYWWWWFPKGKAIGSTSTWHSPEHGWIKIICDRACNLKLGKSAVGMVARNDKGCVLIGKGQAVIAKEAEVAEALAVKTVVIIAKGQGY